jgi:hypothetical protein
VQDHLVPYLQEKAKTHTIILAGPSGVNKTEFARVLHGPSRHVGDVDQLKEVNLDCAHIVFNDFDFSSIGVGDRKITEQDLLHLFEVDMDNMDSNSVNARQASAKISIRAKKTFTTNKSEPFCREFWKCDIDEDDIEADDEPDRDGENEDDGDEEIDTDDDMEGLAEYDADIEEDDDKDTLVEGDDECELEGDVDREDDTDEDVEADDETDSEADAEDDVDEDIDAVNDSEGLMDTLDDDDEDADGGNDCDGLIDAD